MTKLSENTTELEIKLDKDGERAITLWMTKDDDGFWVMRATTEFLDDFRDLLKDKYLAAVSPN